jgi:hypothetical protein
VASLANVFDPRIPHLAMNYHLGDVLFPLKGHGLEVRIGVRTLLVFSFAAKIRDSAFSVAVEKGGHHCTRTNLI